MSIKKLLKMKLIKYLIFIVISLITVMPVYALEKEVYQISLLINGLEPETKTYEGYTDKVFKDFSVKLTHLLVTKDTYITKKPENMNLDMFTVVIISDNEGALYSVHFYVDFTLWTHYPPIELDKITIGLNLPYYENAKYLKIYQGDIEGLNKGQLKKREKLVVELKDNLCNNDGTCNNYEGYYSCPSDCGLDAEDGLCVSDYDDGICDPDCYYDGDCDSDNDGISDLEDNCRTTYNPDQLNSDSQEKGLILHNKLESIDDVDDYGGIVTFESAKFGKGALIDKEDEYIAFPTEIISIPSGTIEFWVKPKIDLETCGGKYAQGEGGECAIFFMIDSGPNGESLILAADSPSLLFLGMTDKDGTYTVLESNIDFKENELMHIAITWNINFENEAVIDFLLYKDGEKIGSSRARWNIENWGPTFQIGGSKEIPGYSLKGVYDNIKIYDYAKTDFSDRNTEIPIADYYGDKCDSCPYDALNECAAANDVDADDILNEDDLCPGTDPRAGYVLDNGCSCEQVKEALAARGAGYAKGVLSEKNLGICESYERSAKGILSKTGRAFGLEGTAQSGAFAVIILIGVLLIIYFLLRKKER